MIDQALRSLIHHRAGEVCEYCRLPQIASPFSRFHVDHIIARQHGGATDAANLALSCGACNFHKGPNIAGFDPETGLLVPLYNPRRDRWSEYFEWQRTRIIGRTPIGRVTADLLAMNDPDRVEIRDDLLSHGEPFCG